MKPLGGFRRRLPLATLVMNPGHAPESYDGRHWMPQLIRETVRVANRGEGLARVAEQPAVDRQVIPAAGAGIVAAVEQCMRCMPIPIIESDPAFGVGDGHHWLPHRREGRPQRMMRLEKPTSVALGLCGLQQPLCALVGLLVLPAPVSDEPQPPEHGKATRYV